MTVAQAAPIRPAKTSYRKQVIILLAISVFLLLVILVSQTAFDLNFLHPGNNQDIAVFAALSALIFLLFVALTFVLMRNLLKLFNERRLGVLGSKFRTRMVAGALILSSLPVMVMYWFAYGLMNRSIDKWFSTPVEEVRADTNAMASLLADYAAQNARAEAFAIAASPDIERDFAGRGYADVTAEFHRHALTLQGGFALAVHDGNQEASFNAPAPWSMLKNLLPISDALAGHPAPFTWENVEYTLGSAPVDGGGAILVAIPLPRDFSQTIRQVESSQQRYYELARERRVVRRTYMGLLLLLTMIVLFVTTWLALFLSKIVTRPLSALAEATQEIARGRLDYRVDVSSADEIGDLVRSFNRMAEDLEGSRRQLETSSRDLSAANAELDQRRRQIETILESIPTGVLSLDANRRVTHVNQAMLRMFNPDGYDGSPQILLGASLSEIFPAEFLEDFELLLRRSDRMGTSTSQMELQLHPAALNVAVTVATLRHQGERSGYVVVFEDLSDLLKAQKQTAWREVARRIAHEIKNPLTPIALSAERIRRHLERASPPDAASLRIIRNAPRPFLPRLRRFASWSMSFRRWRASRLPSRNRPISMQSSKSALMFNGRLDGIDVAQILSTDLPAVRPIPKQ